MAKTVTYTLIADERERYLMQIVFEQKILHELGQTSVKTAEDFVSVYEEYIKIYETLGIDALHTDLIYNKISDYFNKTEK